MVVFYAFFSFFLLYMIGMPIAFSIIVTCMLLYVLNIGTLSLLGLVQTMGTGIDSFILLAVPLFILTGKLMNEAKITDKIFNFSGSLVGHIKGGQAHINVLASLIFAGMSGSAVADTAGLGEIEIKAMTDRGYGGAFSAAITAASSVIGPIFPPSIDLLVYAAISSTSAGKLLLGGVVPGVTMAIVLMIASYIISVKRNYPREEPASLKRILFSFKKAFFPLLTPLVLLAFIAFGITTPTEAAAVVVSYSLILGIVFYKTINMKTLSRILLEVGVTTSVVLIIISAVSSFTWIITYRMLPQQFTEFIFSFSYNPNIVILLIIALLFLIGCIMNPTSGLVMSMPLLLPLAKAIGFNLVQFGVLSVLVLDIGLLTPPVCLCTFISANIAKVSINEVVKESIPFIIVLMLTALLVAFVPALTTFFPELFF